MKMKKLLVISILLAVAMMGYSQATPGKIVRIADRTTTFGANLPAGTQIYCVADSTNWNVKAAGVASTRTINTAWAAAEIEWIRTTVQTTRDADQVNLAIDSTKASYHQVVIDSATTTNAGVMTATMVTKLASISASSGTMTAESFEVASDAATNSQVTLTNVPKDSLGVSVSLNGAELKLTTQFYCGTLSEKKITMKIPVYKYDAVHVTYNK